MSLRRRTPAVAAAVAVGTLAGVLATGAPAQSVPRPAGARDFWPVAAAAYSRPLGSIPAHPASLGPGDAPGNQPYPAGRGIPLGGLGAGSFMYNQAGSFGPWELRTGLHEERILRQGAFHLREQLAGQPATVTTLATRSPWGALMPAWHLLAPGVGRYAALYPFGWTDYPSLHTDVSMRFWSPLVARDDRRSSLPVAYFDLRIADHTAAAADVAAMLTFPNAPLSVVDPRPNTRTGLDSAVVASAGTTGVVLGADGSANVVDAQHSQWALAVHPSGGQTASYLTSWNGNGTGADVYRAFAGSGVLPDNALDASHSAGAVALSAHLLPGQVTTLTFALAWDFPQVLFGSPTGRHTVWMRRYTDFFGARETAANAYVPGSYPFHQAFPIAAGALADESAALAAVQHWWQPYATDPRLPVWLRRAALDELAGTVYDSSFWEGGLVANTFPSSQPEVGPPGGPRIGSLRPGTHLFFDLESPVYPYAESYDVRAYDSRVLGVLWPDIERDVQVAWTDMISQDGDGHAPHDAGSPTLPQPGTTDGTSPYVVWPAYPVRSESWLDLPAKYLLQVWTYLHDTGDWSLLRYAYPAMLASYRNLAAAIPSGGHLPVDNGADNTYDQWGLHGVTSYVGGLWILAQEITQVATERAIALGIPGASQSLVDSIAAELPRSRAEYEADLWDPGHGWYRISTGDPTFGDGVMADALFAEYWAEVLGLPDVVDPAHIAQHLDGSYAVLVAPWHDRTGRLVGAANGVNPNGSLITTAGRQPTEVWTGVSYLYAATQYVSGVRFADPTLEHQGLTVADAVATQIWGVPGNGYAFASPEAWQITDPTSYRALQYARPRAVWNLVFGIDPPPVPGAARGSRLSRARVGW